MIKTTLAALTFAVSLSVFASPTVNIVTNHGNILLELDEDKAPATVANFLDYVKEGFYNNTIFHRVIPDFVIQGGGHDVSLREKPTHEPIANEAHNGLENKRGTIAMARTNNPHSATSQFFINLKDNDNLNPHGVDPAGYAVFGKVIDGMSVVDSIARVKTEQKGGHGNVPVDPVIIEKIDVLPEEGNGDNAATTQEK